MEKDKKNSTATFQVNDSSANKSGDIENSKSSKKDEEYDGNVFRTNENTAGTSK